MTSKSNAAKAKGHDLPAMEVVKSDQPETTQQPTVEDLQKKVQELTAKLEAVPQNLTERIEYFNHKKELIRKLSKLEANAQSLQTHLDKIAEVAAKNEFETDEFILNIEAGGKYNKTQVFALQNPVLIGEVITYLLGKIEAKIDELENEIAA